MIKSCCVRSREEKKTLKKRVLNLLTREINKQRDLCRERGVWDTDIVQSLMRLREKVKKMH